MTYHGTSTDDGNVARAGKVVVGVVLLKDTIGRRKAWSQISEDLADAFEL
jgi:hypothetical protein